MPGKAGHDYSSGSTRARRRQQGCDAHTQLLRRAYAEASNFPLHPRTAANPIPALRSLGQPSPEKSLTSRSAPKEMDAHISLLTSTRHITRRLEGTNSRVSSTSGTVIDGRRERDEQTRRCTPCAAGRNRSRQAHACHPDRSPRHSAHSSSSSSCPLPSSQLLPLSPPRVIPACYFPWTPRGTLKPWSLLPVLVLMMGSVLELVLVPTSQNYFRGVAG